MDAEQLKLEIRRLSACRFKLLQLRSVIRGSCAIVGLLLVFAMFGPLLTGGRVFLLDFADYPIGPNAHLPMAAWGFPPGLVSRVPVQIVLLGIFKLFPWGPIRLLPYLTAPLLVAWGFARLTRDRLAAIAATIVYMLSPFMYERMTAGQIFLVLGFALLPLFLSIITSDAERLSSAVACGLLFAILIALSPHFIFVGGLILVVAAAVRLVLSGWKFALSTFASLAVAAVICLYWIIPAATSVHQLERVSHSDLVAFRTASDPALGLLPNVAGLYGFWRQEVPLTKDNLPGWPVFILVIIGIACVGVWESWRTDAKRFQVLSLGMLGVVGFFLALGAQGPTQGLFLWLFDYFPGFRIMREPEKFLILLTLAYAVFFGRGLVALIADLRSLRWRVGLAALLLALPCIYGLRSFWGFAGYIRSSNYPISWSEADHLMGPGEGKVLALPWREYLPLGFTQDRVVANPMTTFFHRQVIASDSLKLPSAADAVTSSRTRYLSFLVRHGPEINDLGNLLAPLGVRYVVLTRTSDTEDYTWLNGQRDLQVVHQWHDLVLLKNLRYKAPLYAPVGRLTVSDWGAVVSLSTQTRLTDYAITVIHPRPGALTRVSPSSAKGTRSTSVSTQDSDPALVHVVDSPPVGSLAFAEPYDSGWRYGEERPLANLGVTNLFPPASRRSSTIAYAPWRLVRVGYLVGTGGLFASLLMLSLARWREVR